MAAHMTGSVTEWIARVPIASARDDLEAMKAQRAELDRKIAERESLLMLVEGRLPTIPIASYANGNGNGHAEPMPIPASVVIEPPRGMEAVRVLLSEDPTKTWKRADMAKELARREWISQGEKGRRTLGSILHRMLEAGRVARVGTALYKLPVDGSQEVLAA